MALTFTMGLPEAQGDLWLEAKATARVTLERAYYLGITEVLNREYRQWPERRGHRSPDADGGAGSDEDDHPAVGVTWHEAVAFLRWLTVVDNLRRYRLPAEAEWEHACRAGTTSRFWWGDDPVLRPPFPANLLDADVATPPQEHAARPGPPDGARLTAGLEGYRPNPWGLWHTAGNAWEWCWDWYAPHVEGAPRPVGGPPTGSARVQRGGTAQHDWKYARSGARTRELPDATGHLSGFRALLELPEPTTR